MATSWWLPEQIRVSPKAYLKHPNAILTCPKARFTKKAALSHIYLSCPGDKLRARNDEDCNHCWSISSWWRWYDKSVRSETYATSTIVIVWHAALTGARFRRARGQHVVTVKYWKHFSTVQGLHWTNRFQISYRSLFWSYPEKFAVCDCQSMINTCVNL